MNDLEKNKNKVMEFCGVTGQFRTTVLDPLTCQPFPNNQAPASRIDRTSALLLERFVPLPNNPNPNNNFLRQFGTPFDADQYTIRVDHEIGPQGPIRGQPFFPAAVGFPAAL
jgi:hypothetical protein